MPGGTHRKDQQGGIECPLERRSSNGTDMAGVAQRTRDRDQRTIATMHPSQRQLVIMAGTDYTTTDQRPSSDLANRDRLRLNLSRRCRVPTQPLCPSQPPRRIGQPTCTDVPSCFQRFFIFARLPSDQASASHGWLTFLFPFPDSQIPVYGKGYGNVAAIAEPSRRRDLACHEFGRAETGRHQETRDARPSSRLAPVP